MSSPDNKEVQESTEVETKSKDDLPAFEKSITDKIQKKFGDKVEIVYVKPNRTRVNVKKEDVVKTAQFIR